MHNYTNLEEFTRENIRPGMRAGWTLDNIAEPLPRENDFDLDPFEAALRAAEYEEEEEEEEEEEQD